MAYKTKFIDSIRFMAISLSNLADKLAKDLHNSKCKDQKPCLEYVKVYDKWLIFKCLECNKNPKKRFKKDLVKISANTYKFYDGDINKFC